MEDLPLNRPPVPLQGRGYRQKPSRSSSGGCVSTFFGVFFGLLAVIGIAWGVTFRAHIQHEQRIIDGLKSRLAQMQSVPPAGLSDDELSSQSSELTQMIALDSAAHRSQYDPFWFIDGSP
jgi:hypothetical protein